jgi:hypothetical protein
VVAYQGVEAGAPHVDKVLHRCAEYNSDTLKVLQTTQP